MTDPEFWKMVRRWRAQRGPSIPLEEYERQLKERERQERTKSKSGSKNGKKAEISRFKGLGEMFADELWKTTMNPETRVLIQIQLEDAALADQIFSILMGEDVEGRRDFIQQNAQDAFVDV